MRKSPRQVRESAISINYHVGMLHALNWLRHRFKQSAVTAGEILFPPACAICEETVERPVSNAPLFCESCQHELSAVGTFCPRCAMPTPDLPNPSGDCPVCRAEKFAFDGARTLGVYEFARRQAVLRIKHSAFEPLAIQLGKLLAERLRAEPFALPPTVVIPVPMHFLRRIWRGTSAADTMAQTIAREFGLPCITDMVRCKRMLKKQSSLPATERWNNVRGAFGVGWGFDLREARVLIVDDVVTTGSTCHSIARELKKAGVPQVYVAAIARATNMSN
jgi:ComF family protein